MSGSNAAHHPLDEHETKRTLRWLNVHGSLRTAYESVAPAGSFVTTAFILALGLPASDMGLIMGAQSAAAAGQVLGLPIISRSQNRKRLIFLAGVIQPVALAALMIALIWTPPPWRLAVLVAALLPINAIWQAIIPLTDDWLANVIPAAIRGRVMSERKQLFAVSCFIAAPLVGWGVDLVGEKNATGLAILLACLCVPAIIAAMAMQKATMPPPEPDAKPFNLSRLPAVISEPRFKRFLTVSIIMQLPFILAMPLYNVFYFEQFRLEAKHVGLLTALYGAIKLVSFPLWGRALDQGGAKRVLLRVGPIYTVFFLAFAFGTPEYWWLSIFVQVLAALGDAAWNIAFPLVLYRVIPRGSDRPAYFAAYSLIILSANALGAFLTKPVLDWLSWLCRVTSFGTSAYHVLFMLIAVAMAFASLSLRWLEPDED